jgi:hypothetical protein
MKYTITFFTLLLAVSLYSQVSILEENFDSSTIPTTWTTINNDGNTVDAAVQEYTSAWIQKEDPDNAGNGTASSTSYFDPVDRADRWLVTPQFTLGASGNYISWKGMSFDPSYTDSYKVIISTTGNTVADFTDTLAIISNETPDWNEYTEPLNDYANQTIYVAFVNTTYDGFKLFLDSVNVREQDPLSVSEEELELALYPNPVQETLNLKTQAGIQQISIVNVQGQTVKTRTFDAVKKSIKLNVETLKEGVYFVHVLTSKGIIQRKVIKR